MQSCFRLLKKKLGSILLLLLMGLLGLLILGY